LPRRLAALIPARIGITFVAFVLTELVPGDPAAANLGQRAIADPAAVQAFASTTAWTSRCRFSTWSISSTCQR